MEELLVGEAKARQHESQEAQDCTRKLMAQVQTRRIEREQAQDLARRLNAALDIALVSPARHH